MSRVITQVRKDVVDSDNVDTTEVSTLSFAERLVYYLGGVIMSLIALRIILSLLGANQNNAFASFIYSVSYPFVAPFFGLFNYRMQYGVSRFEIESLVALIVWALLTAGLARLIAISRDA